jgi:hypothetical protein
MLRSLRWAGATLPVVLVSCLPSVAGADTYSVYSCRGPLGGPLAAAGWTALQSGTGAVSDSCASGGALTALLPDARPPGNSSAGWRFDAPAGTRVVRVTAQRQTTGLGPSTQSSDIAYTLDTDTATLEKCAPAPDSACVADVTGGVDKQGLDGSWVRFRAQCLNAGDTCSRPLRVDASQFVLGLKDASKPAVANVRLLDAGESSGTLQVRFDAADVGGGVYRALIKIDGKPSAAVPLGGGACTDALPTDADPYQFTAPVPCPLAVAGALASVNVRSLPPGPHAVEIAVEDAAGNETPVYGPVEFPRLNANAGSSVENVIRAKLRMWFVKAPRHGQRITSRFGRRVVTRGVLRDRRGRGIVGARVDVYHLRRGQKRRLLKTGLKSRAKGALTLILPLNVDTRRIQFVYRAVRPGPATSTQTLRLTVRDRRGRVFHRAAR